RVTNSIQWGVEWKGRRMGRHQRAESLGLISFVCCALVGCGGMFKHHFLKIFLWVFAALMVIHLINHREMEMAPFLNNKYLMLLLAILIGLIPQSGPHLIFVSLFLNGHIPFAILLANAIVQDGHSALPLFAESKKAFLTVKISKALVAALIGCISLI
ncbi:MAG: hypothetical protein IIX29_00590, partial [Bacteroidales bacterium]|nr:hypothetical protein [Bacteroidales bacterium]